MQSLLTLLSLLALFSNANARCYFPDGQTVASSNVPCHNNGNATCCGPGYACLSNNICMVTSYVQQAPSVQYIRGSCTDSSWTDVNCPLFCDNPQVGDNQAGGIGMQVCPGSDTSYYCMDSTQSSVNCANGQGVVVFRGMEILLFVSE
jgi:hypothetical protein